MKQLYLKAALGIFGSIFLSFLLSFGVMLSLHKRTEQLLFRHFFGLGMLPLQEQLQQQTRQQAHTWLEAHRSQLSVSAHITTLSQETKQHLKRVETDKIPGLLLHRSYRHFTFYLPLKRAKQYLVLGPVLLPPARSIFVLHLSILAGMVFLLTAVLILPIARRLRTLEQATSAFGKEEFAIQVPEGPNDAFGKLARSFNTMATRIRQLFNDREELLQAVSHELSTPLSRMRFGLELLESATDHKTMKRHMNSLNEDLNELEELSVELVAWLEADASHTKQDYDLAPVLAQLVEQIREDAPEGITLVLEQTEPLNANVELRQFQRAIENLLRNAVRHAHATVIVRAATRASALQIDICDDGEGVPEPQRERIFDPFVSFSQNANDVRSGSGLGLSIVRRIMRRHQGHISLHEAPEGGAHFATFWPLPDQPNKE